jgi:hypothetical protein
MESLTCGQGLWHGRVTAVENIVFFIPFWLWLGCVVYIALRRLPEEVLHFTFFPVALASTLPFFFRRIGLLRFWFSSGLSLAYLWGLPLRVSGCFLGCNETVPA